MLLPGFLTCPSKFRDVLEKAPGRVRDSSLIVLDRGECLGGSKDINVRYNSGCSRKAQPSGKTVGKTAVK